MYMIENNPRVIVKNLLNSIDDYEQMKKISDNPDIWEELINQKYKILTHYPEGLVLSVITLGE